MKCLIVFLAVVVFVSAMEKKPEEKKKAEEKKPEEKKPEEQGLRWPMPDPYSEGDLMLHGAEIYDRVDDLHKAKIEDDAEKSILAHGREFLRRVAKWFDDNADLKVMPTLCRDSRTLNGTINRWRLEIVKDEPQVSPAPARAVQRDQPLPKDEKDEKPKKSEEEVAKVESPKANITSDNETSFNETSSSNATTTSASIVLNDSPIAQNDVLPPSKTTKQPTERPASNSTDRPDETGNSTQPSRPSDESYDSRRRDFYRQVGSNFVRLIQRQFRKEVLKTDESDYLARWLADESVHYGSVAIYCNNGEDTKEIRKQLKALLESKP